MEAKLIKRQFPLDFQWATQEPFLFCVHHHDFFPKGTAQFGPEKSYLKGRRIGEDFVVKDGFRMYHGEVVPGFPVHPHRGFETITIVRKGYVDHADSIGASGRYGQGDVQWMTAGAGVQHSEMFPLLKQDAENTLELFQIWLNLPRVKKMSPPHFTMFWAEKIPHLEINNNSVRLTLIAGEYEGMRPLPPPPDSWAYQTESNTAIWLLKMKPGAEFELPAVMKETNRSLYFFEGEELFINETKVGPKSGIELQGESKIKIKAGAQEVEILLLQSKSMNEPVVQYGPFVMNTEDEIRQTFADFQRTQFGGWTWERPDMIHGSKIERFAKHPGGKVEKP